MSRSSTDARGLQHRITVDADMGGLYDWLRAKSTGNRPRELLYLARLGYEVHQSRGKGMQLPHCEPAPKRQSVGPSTASGQSNRADPIADQERDISVASASFDLKALCKPPPTTKR